MHADSDSLNDLSGRVIGRAFTVLNTVDAGLLEKSCETALAHELREAGLSVVQANHQPMTEHRQPVIFRSRSVIPAI